MSTGTTRVRYHMGSHYWRSRTKLEKLLLVGWGVLILTVTILVAIIHSQATKSSHFILTDHGSRAEYDKSHGGVLFLQKIGGWSIYGNWSAKGYDFRRDIILSQVEYNSGALFAWGVAENDKNSNKYVLEFDQGGLLLPARDYYLNESEKAVAEAYVKYMTKIGVLLGAEENQSRVVAEDILAFETELARISTPDDERRDDEKLYHNMTLNELTRRAPIDWTTFVNSAFKKINRLLSSKEEVVVYAPEYLEQLSQFLFNKTATEQGNTSIHNYLTWHIVKNHIAYLSREFREAYSILEKAQVGISGGEESWRECVAATDAAIGPAVGAMYIRSSFSEQDKKMASEMLEGIRKAFRRGLNSVPWMDGKTKLAALEKADHISDMIGYPEYILDPKELDHKFEDLEFSEDTFFENNMNVTLFKVKENLRRLFEPVNKTKWDMTPPTVNAYYSPTRNSIVFPAGILQPPLFDKRNPPSLNYGAVGVVMGHELSHAFDDQAENMTKNGNLHSWWEPITTEQFNKRTQCMIAQYSNYSLCDEHLKGRLTLGENIADNGGLKASFQAYSEWAKQHPQHEQMLPGLNLTPPQMFFLGFGQVWCSAMTKEIAHLEILRDSHVLPEFRVRGSLSNSHEFAHAYNCPCWIQNEPQKEMRRLVMDVNIL
ncbi:Endothelin-converting enzyme 1 [Armadillidium nasatum]|uniref:Endothelin-converting enzyme 1 n=1 Tax=Armadillidium nasatum TaxID=96803 RepID=A0A5N5SVU1_9CRUS|nr:Endothelin-converting enzyme 1 [Armadillidium nasatum]